MRVSALVTAYFPDERLHAVVETAAASCTQVIVVDNTPADAFSASARLAARPGVVVLRPGDNRGLAGGLNTAARSLDRDAEAVLLLDQDSVLGHDHVGGLAPHLADPAVAVAAPVPVDARSGESLEPPRRRRPPAPALHALRRLARTDRRRPGAPVRDRDTVITSGMLVRRSVFERFQPFREEFFVDFVDADFCLRVRRGGHRIVQDTRVTLRHSLGERRRYRFLGLSLAASVHPAWRLYWIARNGTVLVRENWLRKPWWSARTASFLYRWFLLRVLFEPPRLHRPGWMLRGFADGWRGRRANSGP
ncbi:glycosyltransferase [Actinoplanes sp. NPDC051861]|uniref:glycosyltransferase n=1 Tax=Actinoplanes sp. NPDC051861 TaxID=3155170 RepID=UPI003415B8A6